MTTDEARSTPHPADPAPPNSLRALFQVPGYRYLCVSSFIWHTTRWGGLFTTSYLLVQLSGSPILNQVVGALIFAPMLAGGFVAGVISDRLDRRKLVRRVQLVLIPIEFAMFGLVQSGRVEIWMTFPFMFALGIGGLVNMTAQRPLIFETVGPRFGGQAMTIESTAQAGSAMFGTLGGGALIDHVGMGAGFAGMGVLLCFSAALLWLVPSPRYATPRDPGARVSIAAQAAASIGLARRSRRLLATLGVTVAMNLFMFGYIPLVPLVADEFSTDAVLAGALGAAAGCGQILCGIVLSTRPIHRHGLVFAVGSMVALLGLFCFSTAPLFGLAFLALFVAGMGQGGFGSMQSLLAIESAHDTERGAALGVLSTAIGALPLGMVAIGAGAELLGTRNALMLSSMVGMVAVLTVVLRLRDLLSAAPETALRPSSGA
ncbi:MFS transporter [Streptomyces sp. NPDC002926]